MDDFRGPLITYLFCQLACLAVLKKPGRRFSDRFWKTTEFASLAVAMVSFVGLLVKFEQKESASQIQLQETRLDAAVNSTKVMCKLLEGLIDKELMVYRVENPGKANTTKVVELISDIERLRQLDLILQSESVHKEYKNDREACQNLYSKIDNQNAKERTTKRFNQINQIEDELDDLRSSTKWSARWAWLERNFLYFLAVGLAIKITRHVAESFVLTKGTSWWIKPKTPTVV